jgi:hypothetical protein
MSKKRVHGARRREFLSALAAGPANIVRNLQRCGFTAAELSAIERETRSESLVVADLKVGPCA